MPQKKNQKTSFRIFLVIAFLAMQQLTSVAQTTTNNEAPGLEQYLIIIGGILVIVVITILIMRKLIDAKVKKQMNAMSSEQAQIESFKLEGKEIPAHKKLSFLELNADADLPEAVACREKFVKDAVQQFRSAYYNDLLAVVAYLIVFYLGTKILISNDFVIELESFLIIFAFFMTVRFLSFQKQFQAYYQDNSALAILGKLLPFTWKSLADPRWGPFLAFILMAATTYYTLANLGNDIFNLILLLGVAIHYYLLSSYQEKLKKTPNIKLLVLRVFGMDKAAHFTFEGLISFWKHFGSFFTVADPSFLDSKIRQQDTIFKIFIWGIPLAFVLGFTVFNPLVEKLEQIHVIVILISTIILAILFVRNKLKEVDSSFLQNKTHLHQRVEKLLDSPRKWSHSFKNMPILCHNDTWRIAVSEFVEISDVILMDLRGLSTSRGGCKEEVDYLFDAAPVSKVVFLVDQEALPLVEEMLKEQWAKLNEHSPNFKVDSPTATIYLAAKEDKKDIQGIMDVLFHTAIRSGGIKL